MSDMKTQHAALVVSQPRAYTVREAASCMLNVPAISPVHFYCTAFEPIIISNSPITARYLFECL